jgi:recombination protein RecA
MADLQTLPIIHASDLKPHIQRKEITDSVTCIPISTFAGRLTEWTSAVPYIYLTPLCSVIRTAQISREPTVWISCCNYTFFPPDAANHGISLENLPLIKIRTVKHAVRASEHLLRSGAFGLIIIDLPVHIFIEQGKLGKLARLADLHNTAVIISTKQEGKYSTTLGSMISLRLEIGRQYLGANKFRYTIHATKDKQRTPGWKYSEVYYGPAGLR